MHQKKVNFALHVSNLNAYLNWNAGHCVPDAGCVPEPKLKTASDDEEKLKPPDPLLGAAPRTPLVGTPRAPLLGTPSAPVLGVFGGAAPKLKPVFEGAEA